MHAETSIAADTDRRERLGYVADLLGELQRLASYDQGCETLVALLALSCSEARRQSLNPHVS
jgi:hypothetical protein